MKETGTAEQTPEQLLKFLEVETAMRRARRTQSGRNRAILLVAGLLFILIGTGVALLVLDQMLANLPPPNRAPQAASGEAPGNF